jgi:hypothetical protein
MLDLLSPLQLAPPFTFTTETIIDGCVHVNDFPATQLTINAEAVYTCTTTDYSAITCGQSDIAVTMLTIVDELITTLTTLDEAC